MFMYNSIKLIAVATVLHSRGPPFRKGLGLGLLLVLAVAVTLSVSLGLRKS